MNKILVLFTHPVVEKSRVHSTLLESIKNTDGITINDLYELYPDFDIDIKREQQLLLSHDIIVWQHPFYWYSSPALLKQWQDLVLEHQWAYGRNGNYLKGKRVFNALTSGGGKESYELTGRQHCTLEELLRPFERTASLCQMTYLPPFWIAGTHKLDMPEIQEYGLKYRQLLLTLRDKNLGDETLCSYAYLNELTTPLKNVQ